jgi:hypothetical protein
MSDRQLNSSRLTAKQRQATLMELEKIKKVLAAEKAKFGGYDDSRGLRYLPPSMYIQIGDFPGGLRYMQWFEKNFPDDIGMPDFLFEWAFLLFKAGKLNESERKLYRTFFSNTYLLSAFLGQPLIPIEKWECSNLESPLYTQYLNYSHEDPGMVDFAVCVARLMNTEQFVRVTDEFVSLHKKLKQESDQELCSYLLAQISKLKERAG